MTARVAAPAKGSAQAFSTPSVWVLQGGMVSNATPSTYGSFRPLAWAMVVHPIGLPYCVEATE
ncbi:MAG TPA: hypothetical protein ACQGQI_09785, partial [Xylella sp.]